MGALFVMPCQATAQAKQRPPTPNERLGRVLAETQPLKMARAGRIPVIIWPLQGVVEENDEAMSGILKRLDERGLAMVGTWDYRRLESALPKAMRLARLQKALGLEVVVDTTGVVERFFNGDPSTAHIAEDGSPFFDESFSPRVKIGCPFSVRHRYPAIREQVETFARAYRESGLAPQFAMADWEIDGPIEWNDAWQMCRRCKRCRQNIPGIEDFSKFQASMRTVRSEMQSACYAEPMRQYFPELRVGNYAVYPHDGFRYWYDYFEKDFSGPGARRDGGATYRPWHHEFSGTGYNLAIPVVYTWYRTFGWYEFDDPDYRWFYNMLSVATNAGRSAPHDLPIVSFVHWHMTSPPDRPDPAVIQFGQSAYQELLWHMLLRGHDGFAMWCRPEEIALESRLVQEVFAESLQFNEFIFEGKPVEFEVPSSPAPVVSALRLGDRLLVRRTDFGKGTPEISIHIDGKPIAIPSSPGKCQIISVVGR